MLKIFITFLFLTLQINASEVINQTIYEKDNRVDIMLSFDTPYDGKISQRKDEKDIILLLKDAHLKKEINKKIISPLVQKMKILPYQGGVIVKLSSDEDFEVKASKTVDNYGLRLRITPKNILNMSTLDEDLVIQEKNFTTKKEDDISGSYVKVILILLALIGLLYFLKRWVLNNKTNLGSSWLFDKNQDISKSKNGIKILQQKALDHKNRVSLISFEDKKYLLLLGESNLLLDKFDEFATSEFDTHLQENERALNDFISQKSKFDSYKDKASNSKI